jgi:predicted outer membrane protein
MSNRFAIMFDLMLCVVGATTACSTSNRDTYEAGGEVVASARSDSTAAQPVRWLTDANLLSLLGVMNARQIAAADVELEAWHVDSVRAFAAAVAREHAELQHSADSVAERIHLTPIAPALAQTVSAALQSQIDTLRRSSSRALDRAFVHEQVASYGIMTEYVTELAAVAEQPEMRILLTFEKDSLVTQLARARALQTKLAAADSSAAADSAAKSARLAAKLASKHARGIALP